MLPRLQSTSLTTFFSTLTGLAPDTASWLLLIIFAYIIFMIIFIPIHRSILRAKKKVVESLTREYDNLRYLIAQAQKKSQTATTHLGIKILFDVKNADYLHQHDMILQEIQGIETELHVSIADDATRKKISKLSKKRKNLSAFANILGWILSVLTVFIYRLFW